MKISINEPCHENWDNMKPNDKGAFCLSCKKNVVDFSSKTLTQIKDFFNELPSSNNVCGRFKEKQLTEMSLDHFLNEFMSWKFVKRAAVIFYLSLGAVLFSACSGHDKDIVGEIETLPDSINITKRVNDTLTENVMMLGEPAIEKDASTCEEDKNKIDNTKSKHLIGGPMVQKDTAAINKKTKSISENLVKELNPKETKQEKVNEIAPGKSK